MTSTQLLVSCCNLKGALYVVDVDHWSYKEVLDVPCNGMAKYDQYYLVVSFYKGVMLLDQDFKIAYCDEHSGLDYHGAAVHNDHAYIIDTMTNTIRIYELPSLHKVDEIRISPIDEDVHHVNDLYIAGDRLFVSMFSLEGEWRPKMHQPSGAIVEYSLSTGKRVDVHYANRIHHPHSVQLYKDQLLFCNSYNREVRHGKKVIFRTHGYSRGLAVHQSTIYIGNSSSANRKGDPSQAGIYERDPNQSKSRFLALPSEEVYGILFIEG